jgi:hypothetical protein
MSGETSSGMRSETLPEAAARMKALSEAEKRGMEIAREGILAHDPDPDGVFEERAAVVDQIGEKLLQVQQELTTDMDFSATTEVGEDGTAQPRRTAKRSRRRG